VPPQSRGLALLAVTGLALALTTACSSGGSSQTAASPPASTAASSPAAAASGSASTGPDSNATGSSTPASSSAGVPSGYKRIGGAAQGISVAVPSSWADVDLSKQTAAQGISNLKLSKVSAAQLTQSLSALQQSKAVVAADLTYAETAKGHFTRNINAYCTQTEITDTGAAGVPVLESSMQTELSSIGTHVTEKDATIGGVPGVESSYQVQSGTVGTLYGSQLEVLPKPKKACFVTLTSLQPTTDSDFLAVAAKTAQFP
jgi:hypothetical protein